MYRILLILYIIWGGVSIASGQDFNYSFTQLSTNQGLSQASVTSVTMDQKGRLWIGTQSGLNYYFQQQLKTFIHHESDSLSLPNNYINHIVEDSLGTIWVATSKEMVLYNSDNHNFTPTGYNCIYSSLCIEGGILFGSENIIFRYNYKSRTMDSIYICQKKNLDISEYRIQKMVQLKKNKILIGTKEQGIYLYDCCTQQLTRFTSDIHHLLISLYVVSDKYVYASFYGNGIYCYNQDGKIVKSYTSKTSSLNKYFEKIGNTEMDITDEIPFEIPDSWSWVRLNDICSYIQRGKSPKYSLIKKYPVVAQKCNQWSGFSIDKAQFIDPDTLSSYGEERILQDGDLMWNSTGLGTLGRMAIYWSSLNPYELAVADSHVTVIRVMKKFVMPQYLYYYFTSNTVQSVIEDKSDGSTKQKELATSTVKTYLVPIPPLMEQNRIISQIKQLASIMRE